VTSLLGLYQRIPGTRALPSEKLGAEILSPVHTRWHRHFTDQLERSLANLGLKDRCLLPSQPESQLKQ
jgi:hypothetical protein